MSLEAARSTAYMGANDDEYPGTRYVIDCGGQEVERYIVKMNPFTLENGQKIVYTVKRGNGVGRFIQF